MPPTAQGMREPISKYGVVFDDENTHLSLFWDYGVQTT
jgi:hypothetical protein